MTAGRGTGAQEHRNKDAQDAQDARMQECRNAGIQACKNAPESYISPSRTLQKATLPSVCTTEAKGRELVAASPGSLTMPRTRVARVLPPKTSPSFSNTQHSVRETGRRGEHHLHLKGHQSSPHGFSTIYIDVLRILCQPHLALTAMRYTVRGTEHAVQSTQYRAERTVQSAQYRAHTLPGTSPWILSWNLSLEPLPGTSPWNLSLEPLSGTSPWNLSLAKHLTSFDDHPFLGLPHFSTSLPILLTRLGY